MNKSVLAIAMSLVLGACAHQWTPEELADMERQRRDPCYRSESMAPSATVWCRSSGTQPPIIPAPRTGQNRQVE